MKLIEVEDYETNSAYSYFHKKGDKSKDKEIDEFGQDRSFIEEDLEKQYPSDKFFVLVDYIDYNKGDYFRIRVWEMVV
ncbi:MAG: hypothetical protein CL811_10530 [Colwelliaceae bacterium]|jgi:hypothetical protein|nr:hypothetical protein [Colwelliaceae bacterium]|tara:strand:+ start:1783 stop:2016 length:234 start_codon:yes stop_codon:yes gene_type:complete